MSPKLYQFRQIRCEVCGQERRAEQKNRDICRQCLRQEQGVRCARCGRMKHRVAEETGWCPSCARVLARPMNVCSCCSRTDLIYNQEEQLCQACEKRRRRNIRARDKQTKVACTVCGKMRSSALLGRAICPACWREEHNGRRICSGCNRLKVI